MGEKKAGPIAFNTWFLLMEQLSFNGMVRPGNTKGGSITVPLTSCLTGLESAG